MKSEEEELELEKMREKLNAVTEEEIDEFKNRLSPENQKLFDSLNDDDKKIAVGALSVEEQHNVIIHDMFCEGGRRRGLPELDEYFISAITSMEKPLSEQEIAEQQAEEARAKEAAIKAEIENMRIALEYNLQEAKKDPIFHDIQILSNQANLSNEVKERLDNIKTNLPSQIANHEVKERFSDRFSAMNMNLPYQIANQESSEIKDNIKYIRGLKDGHIQNYQFRNDILNNNQDFLRAIEQRDVGLDYAMQSEEIEIKNAQRLKKEIENDLVAEELGYRTDDKLNKLRRDYAHQTIWKLDINDLNLLNQLTLPGSIKTISLDACDQLNDNMKVLFTNRQGVKRAQGINVLPGTLTSYQLNPELLNDQSFVDRIQEQQKQQQVISTLTKQELNELNKSLDAVKRGNIKVIRKENVTDNMKYFLENITGPQYGQHQGNYFLKESFRNCITQAHRLSQKVNERINQLNQLELQAQQRYQQQLQHQAPQMMYQQQLPHQVPQMMYPQPLEPLEPPQPPQPRQETIRLRNQEMYERLGIAQHEAIDRIQQTVRQNQEAINKTNQRKTQGKSSPRSR